MSTPKAWNSPLTTCLSVYYTPITYILYILKIIFRHAHMGDGGLLSYAPPKPPRCWSWRTKKRCPWDIEWRRIPMFGQSHPCRCAQLLCTTFAPDTLGVSLVVSFCISSIHLRFRNRFTSSNHLIWRSFLTSVDTPPAKRGSTTMRELGSRHSRTLKTRRTQHGAIPALRLRSVRSLPSDWARSVPACVHLTKTAIHSYPQPRYSQNVQQSCLSAPKTQIFTGSNVLNYHMDNMSKCVKRWGLNCVWCKYIDLWQEMIGQTCSELGSL